MLEIPPVYFWLAAFAALLAAMFLVKNEKIQPRIVDALLIVATVFVGQHIYFALNPTTPAKGSATGVADSDKAEFALKIAQALQSTSQVFTGPKLIDRHQKAPGSSPFGGPPVTAESQAEKLQNEAQKVIGDLVQKNPNAPILESKYAILTHSLGEPNSLSLERLSHIEGEKAQALHKALTVLYATSKPTKTEFEETGKTINTILTPGWFQNRALLDLYQKSGQHHAYDALNQTIVDNSAKLIMRMVLIICIMAISFLVGIGVIIAQLFFLPRKLTTEEQRPLIAAPIPFKFRTIYGVFIAWLVTQVLLSSLLKSAVHISDFMNKGVFAAACLTAFLYFASNGPGLLYIWLIACRPNKLPFLDTVKFRLKVGKLGIGRLALAGWLTWFAGVPIVIVLAVIAFNIFHTEGSSNPVIALVMEAARSADVPSILMFYFTLGVLAPICEESLFRGFLYPSLRTYWGVFPSLMLTAFLFAFVHMDFGGFLPLFGLGFLFGFVVERTKSTLSSMVAHGLWNSGTFTMVFLLFGS